MKTLELENYGVMEMKSEEIKTVDGGNPYALAVLCSVVASALYDFSNGMYDEHKSRKKNHGAGGSY